LSVSKRVLILTNSADLHADILVSRLRDKRVEPFRLDLDRFPRDFEFGHAFDQDGVRFQLSHLASNDQIDDADIGAVWVRKSADFSYLSELEAQEKHYADAETEHVLNGFLYSLDCYWMNHPLAVRSACWKAEQSARAARLGFNIPSSLVTNQPNHVVEFRARLPEQIITKPMSTSFLAADKVAVEERVAGGLSTTLITDDHMQDIEAVKEIPCLFQGYVPKAYEVRVTVIGQSVFAAKIHSQDDARTAIDFRDFSAEVRYETYDLPTVIEERCRQFVHSYGLQYGAIDLIVTPDQEFFFLENNPAGQFWFVEQLVPELPMMNAIADCLIEGASIEIR